MFVVGQKRFFEFEDSLLKRVVGDGRILLNVVVVVAGF